MGAKRPLRLAIYTLEHMDWACAQLRVVQPLLSCDGLIEPMWGTAVSGAQVAADARFMDSADAILFQRTFPLDDGMPLFEQAKATGKPVLYDMDDNLFEVPDTDYFRKRRRPNAQRVAQVCCEADAVSVSTVQLADRVRAAGAGEVHVVPNLIPERLWRRGGRRREARQAVRIGFVGTPTHEDDLCSVEDVLEEAAHRHGQDVELIFFGCITPRLRKLSGVRLQRFDDGYASFVRTLPTLGLDIAVAPLADNSFNRCKSNIKWLEYAMAGIAGIYSDLPPYSADVVDGETGFLASSPEQWAKALDILVTDAGLRTRITEKAQYTVLERYSLARRGGEYHRFWTAFS